MPILFVITNNYHHPSGGLRMFEERREENKEGTCCLQWGTSALLLNKSILKRGPFFFPCNYFKRFGVCGYKELTNPICNVTSNVKFLWSLLKLCMGNWVIKILNSCLMKVQSKKFYTSIIMHSLDRGTWWYVNSNLTLCVWLTQKEIHGVAKMNKLVLAAFE